MENKSVDKELVTFYFLKFNKLFLFEEPSSSPTTTTTECLLFHLLLRYEVKEIGKLKKYPNVIRHICEQIMAEGKFISTLEKGIMDESFFSKKEYKNFSDYLNDIQDEQLLKRIDQVSRIVEDCFICFQNDAIHVTSCGHSICKDCFQSLSSPKCPFCRKKNVTLFLKSEVQVEKVETEEKPMVVTRITKKLSLVENEKEFLQNRIKSLLSMGAGKLTVLNMEELNILLKFFPDEMLKSFKNIQNEELICYFVGQIVMIKERKEIVEELMTKHIMTPNRMLRFLSVLNGGTADTDKPIKLKKLNKFMRKRLVKNIEGFKLNSDICGQFKQHEGIWRKFYILLHVMKEKKFRKYKNVILFGNCIFGNEKYPCQSNASIIDSCFEKKDFKSLSEFFQTSPGLFFRNAIRVCEAFKEEKTESLIQSMLPKLKVEQLIELQNTLESYNKERQFFTKFGTFHFSLQLDDRIEWNENHSILLKETLKNILSKIKSDQDSISIIDPEIKNVHIPKGKLQEPIINLNKIPANRGDKFYLDKELMKKEDTEIVFFIYWKDGKQSIDLDLSVMGLNSKFNYLGKCDYSNRIGFKNTMFHSGDFVEAPNGASEFVRFNIENFKKLNGNVKYIVLASLSYCNVSFDDMGDAYVGVGYKSKNQKGTGPYDSILIDSCRLSGTSQLNLGAYIDVEECSITFMNMNISNKGSGTVSVGGKSNLLSTCVERFQHWMDSRSVPSNWLFISRLFSSSVSNVYLVNQKTDGVEFLEIQKEKDSIDFYENILKSKTCKTVQEIDFEKTKKIYYFGNPSPSILKLPTDKEIVVVSTNLSFDFDSEKWVILDNPFKVFNLKN